jgi:hypothetical protein
MFYFYFYVNTVKIVEVLRSISLNDFTFFKDEKPQRLLSIFHLRNYESCLHKRTSTLSEFQISLSLCRFIFENLELIFEFFPRLKERNQPSLTFPFSIIFISLQNVDVTFFLFSLFFLFFFSSYGMFILQNFIIKISILSHETLEKIIRKLLSGRKMLGKKP